MAYGGSTIPEFTETVRNRPTPTPIGKGGQKVRAFPGWAFGCEYCAGAADCTQSDKRSTVRPSRVCAYHERGFAGRSIVWRVWLGCSTPGKTLRRSWAELLDNAWCTRAERLVLDCVSLSVHQPHPPFEPNALQRAHG